MKIDLILFAGQSNMAGRGTAEEAPRCEAYMGQEFRAVSDTGRLYPIEEPFGKRENNPQGMDDGERKTGSLVSAFVREYYERTGHTVIAVSASKGGSSSKQWAAGYVRDAAERLRRARAYLDKKQIQVAHTYVLWSQGETDGDHGVSAGQYRENFRLIWETLKEAGAESCFLIQTGHFNYVEYPQCEDGVSGREIDGRYAEIRRAQEDMCSHGKDAVPGVYLAARFGEYLHLMKDRFHYKQQAYNEVGRTAAANMAERLSRGGE